MPKTWLPKARRCRTARRRTVPSRFEVLEDRNLLSTLTASILSAPALSPNGDGVQDTSTIKVQYAGATAGTTQVGIAVENQAAQVIYQAPQVTAGSAAGTLSFTWDGKDAGGNVVADGTYAVLPVLNSTLFISPRPITVDTTAPTVTPAAPASGTFVRGSVPLSVTVTDASSITRVEIYVDQSAGPVGVAGFSPATRTWNYSLVTSAGPTALADGDHTWVAKAYDAAGNSASDAPQTIRVDNSGPKVTVALPGVGVLGETPLTFTGAASDSPALPGYGVAAVQVTVSRASDGTVLSSGTATLTPAAGGGVTWTYAYAPAEAGLQKVAAKVIDQAGNTGGYVSSFTVDDRPVVTLPAGLASDEGTKLTAAGSFADPDGTSPPDSWTATVNYGDGGPTQSLALNPDKTFSLGHVFADNGTYTITVNVRDKYGVTGTATTTDTVNNIAPGLVLLTPHPAVLNENGFASVNGTFTDPGTKDTHTVDIDWGDGSAHDTFTLGPGALSFVKAHQYLDDSNYTIAAIVTDKDGANGAGDATIQVDNVRPGQLVLTPGATELSTGTPLTLAGTFVDPGTLDTHTVTVNWGDGSAPDNLDLPAGVLTFSDSHTYQGKGSDNITVTVTDKDGGTTSAGTTVTVDNAPPADLTLTPGATTINENDTLTLGGGFTDPDTLDTHTVTIDWGDGSTPDTVSLPAGTLTFAGSTHTYLDNLPGDAPYTVTVTVADPSGGSTQATAAIVVQNVAPVPTINLDPSELPALPGVPVTLGCTVDDPGTLDTFSFQWGVSKDGGAFSLADGVATDEPGFTFTPRDVGHYVVSLQVTDNDGAGNTATFSLDVTNPPPAVELSGDGQVSEGGAYTLTVGPVTDAAPGGVTAYTIHWGDGTSDVYDAGRPLPADGAVRHTYADGPAADTITVDVQDVRGTFAAVASQAVTVLNVPPTPTITGAPASGPEGAAIALGSTVTDPGPADVAAGFTYAWSVTKNGSPYAAGTGAGFTFTPDDNGTYVATLTVTDKDGGAGTTSQTVTVTNVAPTVSIAGPVTGTAGLPLSFQGSFKDPGSADLATEAFAWEVTTGTGKVVQTGNQQNFSVTLTTPGRYLVSLRVTDKDGGTRLVAKSLTVAPLPAAWTGASQQALFDVAVATVVPFFRNRDWGRLF